MWYVALYCRAPSFGVQNSPGILTYRYILVKVHFEPLIGGTENCEIKKKGIDARTFSQLIVMEVPRPKIVYVLLLSRRGEMISRRFVQGETGAPLSLPRAPLYNHRCWLVGIMNDGWKSLSCHVALCRREDRMRHNSIRGRGAHRMTPETNLECQRDQSKPKALLVVVTVCVFTYSERDWHRSF